MKTMTLDTQFLLESHSYDLDVLFHLGFTQEAIDFFLKKTILRKKGAFFEFDFVGFLYQQDKEFFVCPKYRKTVYAVEMIPVFKKLFSIFKTETVSSENLHASQVLSRTILNDYIQNGSFKEEQIKADSDWDSVCWDDLVCNSENFMDGRLIVSEPQTFSKTFSVNPKSKKYQECFISFVLQKNPEIIKEIRVPSSFLKTQSFSEKEMLEFFRSELKRTRLYREKRILKFYVDFLSVKETDFQYIGTKFFHTIWENICKSVFNDQSSKYNKSFPKPVYTIDGKESKMKGHIPDVISLPDAKTCYVLDAKYYNVEKGVPQTEDITKQLFYEKLCKRLFPKHKLFNAFLFMNEQEENIKNIGNVIYDVFDEKEIVLYSLKDTFMLSLFCEEKTLNPKMLPL